MSFLGLDIGTSAVKAVIVDEDERVLGRRRGAVDDAAPRAEPVRAGRAPLGRRRSRPSSTGSARCSPACAASACRARCMAPSASTPTDVPVRPTILWNDGRAAREARDLNRAHPDLSGGARRAGRARLHRAEAALDARGTSRASFAATRRVLLPKDFVRLFLTGEHVTDMSDAAGTWWLDQARRDWSEEALAATASTAAWCRGWSRARPSPAMLRPAWRGAGAWRPGRRRRRRGRRHGGRRRHRRRRCRAVPVARHLGAAFRAGPCHRPAPSIILMPSAMPCPGAGRRSRRCSTAGVAWPGCPASSASPSRPCSPSVGELAEGPGAVTFLPYLTGDRTPHNDAEATRPLHRPDARHLRAPILPRRCWRASPSRSPTPPPAWRRPARPCSRAAVIGGGARSPLWIQILADVLGLPLGRYRGGEKGPAFGAARLGRGGGDRRGDRRHRQGAAAPRRRRAAAGADRGLSRQGRGVPPACTGRRSRRDRRRPADSDGLFATRILVIRLTMASACR